MGRRVARGGETAKGPQLRGESPQPAGRSRAGVIARRLWRARGCSGALKTTTSLDSTGQRLMWRPSLAPAEKDDGNNHSSSSNRDDEHSPSGVRRVVGQPSSAGLFMPDGRLTPAGSFPHLPIGWRSLLKRFEARRLVLLVFGAALAAVGVALLARERGRRPAPSLRPRPPNALDRPPPTPPRRPQPCPQIVSSSAYRSRHIAPAYEAAVDEWEEPITGGRARAIEFLRRVGAAPGADGVPADYAADLVSLPVGSVQDFPSAPSGLEISFMVPGAVVPVRIPFLADWIRISPLSFAVGPQDGPLPVTGVRGVELSRRETLIVFLLPSYSASIPILQAGGLLTVLSFAAAGEADPLAAAQAAKERGDPAPRAAEWLLKETVVDLVLSGVSEEDAAVDPTLLPLPLGAFPLAQVVYGDQDVAAWRFAKRLCGVVSPGPDSEEAARSGGPAWAGDRWGAARFSNVLSSGDPVVTAGPGGEHLSNPEVGCGPTDGVFSVAQYEAPVVAGDGESSLLPLLPGAAPPLTDPETGNPTWPNPVVSDPRPLVRFEGDPFLAFLDAKGDSNLPIEANTAGEAVGIFLLLVAALALVAAWTGWGLHWGRCGKSFPHRSRENDDKSGKTDATKANDSEEERDTADVDLEGNISKGSGTGGRTVSTTAEPPSTLLTARTRENPTAPGSVDSARGSHTWGQSSEAPQDTLRLAAPLRPGPLSADTPSASIAATDASLEVQRIMQAGYAPRGAPGR